MLLHFRNHFVFKGLGIIKVFINWLTKGIVLSESGVMCFHLRYSLQRNQIPLVHRLKRYESESIKNGLQLYTPNTTCTI